MKTEELKQRYNLEENFLEKLKDAYTNYNAECIKDFLSDNVTYDSIWVIEQITNKTDYCRYLEQKLNAMKETNKVINFRIMYEKTADLILFLLLKITMYTAVSRLKQKITLLKLFT